MQLGHCRSLFLRLASSVVKPPLRGARSVPLANFSSGSNSGERPPPQHEEESRDGRVSVCWDFEKCFFHTDLNGINLAQNITSALRSSGIKGPITIAGFGDLVYLSKTNQEALVSTGISLTHVPRDGDDSVAVSLAQSLVSYAIKYGPPAHLFVISYDEEIAPLLEALRKSKYNILVAGLKKTMSSGPLSSVASIMWDWDTLVRGEDFTGKHFNQPPDQSLYDCESFTNEESLESNSNPEAVCVDTDNKDD